MKERTMKKNYKLTAEEKAIKLETIKDNIINVLNSYENLTFKTYNNKNKISIQIEDTNTNIFEVFYTAREEFHICTKINLTKFDKDAKYHELWDMKYDLYTNTYNYLEEIIDFIFEKYNENIA